jgi:hypothetical protein
LAGGGSTASADTIVVAENPKSAIDVARDGDEIRIVIRTAAQPTDALIAFTPAGLKAHGIEFKPAAKFAAEGLLKTVWIGRRRFTSVARLLALVDVLPTASAAEQIDELAEAVAKRAAKRAR